MRLFGAALALTSVLTAIYWLVGDPLSRILDPNTPAICWPFFESCYAWRILNPPAITALVIALGLVGCLSFSFFLDQDTAPAGYWLLYGLTIAKLVILAQDFRLLMNQHYMTVLISAVFLILPDRRRAIPYLLCIFYFMAGLLKLNGDWASGAALYGLRPLGLPVAFVPAACLYVIPLELVIVWGTLSRRPWLFWPAISQLFLFHVASFWIVGFFYPLLMFLLLSVHLLVRRYPPVGLFTPRSTATAAVLVTAIVLQGIPHLLGDDPALTGEGRMFALNMFDAPVVCKASVTIRSDGQTTTRPLMVPYLQARLGCDPIVFRAAALDLCRALRRQDVAADLDWTLASRRAQRGDWQLVASIRSMCSTPGTYSIIRHNEWIFSK